MDYLDADADWALVFADDVAALYLRRNGAQAATASREAYQWVPGGDARITRMARAVEVDGEVRDVVRAELARMIADSPRCGQAHSQLANLEGLDERWEHVIDELEIARRINPGLPRITEREQLAHDHLLGVRPDR